VRQLDVVICTYNNASLLDRTLESLGNQRTPPDLHWSVLVVDNNCTDNTSTVFNKHLGLGKIPHLSKIVELRQGLTPARLCGVRNTSADWLAFLDDDCLVAEDWVANAVAFAYMHPTYAAFGGKVIPEWEHPPPNWLLKFRYCFAKQDHGPRPKEVSCLVGAGMVINRAALQRCGWLNHQFLNDRVGTEVISGGDVEIALRLAAVANLWYTPECEIRHVIPTWRTSPEYLARLNRGLGASKLLGDSMLWSGAPMVWIGLSMFRTLGEFLASTVKLVAGRLGGRLSPALALSSTFVRGEWDGIRQLVSMPPESRRALIGCAKLPRRSRGSE